MTDDTTRTRFNVFSLLGTFWTIPNMLSLFRLLLVIPITWVIIVDGPLALMFGLVLLAVITDWLDGRIARWTNTVTEWGKVLDPLADKFAAVMVVLGLVIRGSLPVWLLVILLVRDVLIVTGGVVLARRTGHVAMSVMAGKAAVTVLAVTVLAALLRADAPLMQVLIVATAVMMIYSLLVYAVRFFRLYNYGPQPHDQMHPATRDYYRGPDHPA